MTYLYILRSANARRALYVGVCDDVDSRLVQHNSGEVRSTSRFCPWECVYVEEWADFGSARKREVQIKKWTRLKKEALVLGEFGKLKKLSQCRGGRRS